MKHAPKPLLILCPYPPGRAPSQRFRFEQYLHLVPGGYRLHSFWTDAEWPAIYRSGRWVYKVWATLRAFGRRLCLVPTLSRYRAVWVHREATPIGPPWLEYIAARVFKLALYYDFDDAIWLPNASAANSRALTGLKNYTKVAQILRWSKLALAGNEYLAAWSATRGAASVRLPTTVDLAHHRRVAPQVAAEQAHTPVIGWTGTHSTLRQLLPLLPTLEALHARHPFKLLVIADQSPVRLPAFAEFIPWSLPDEIAQLTQLDIGLMPLYHTEWELGKCGFKALQYQALSTPVVLSDVGVNARVCGFGRGGLLCAPMRSGGQLYPDWLRALERLLGDVALRRRMGEAGRAWVEQQYSSAAWSPFYSALFSGASAAELRAKAPAYTAR